MTDPATGSPECKGKGVVCHLGEGWQRDGSFSHNQYEECEACGGDGGGVGTAEARNVSDRLHSEMPAIAYIADEAPPFDSEPMRAAVAARAILDDAGRDPDDLLSMLSRQLLRSRETADRLRGDNEVLRLQLRAKRWTTDRAEAEGGDEMERLREALRFYAYPDQVKAEASWSDGYPGGIVWREPGAVHIDTGEIARTALKAR
jgi:hypothetical protein